MGASQVVQFLKRLERDERGATAVEYGLILALIFLALVGAVEAFGQETIEMWNNISSEVQAARD
ncbi:Flp family type IVb pilin [Erythrobacter vulgaris]|uniref:Flp family type IVb pilin n=1 Tax=Qipengyuania vulgaris TaxID=291985 RepID=A0A844XUH7_9SPHN|nr:Flp family type IVb pilin [Qipengyuania vulgaris]MXO49134.1 Flp family type IVb pilin [Qipengyuania vulgaris]